MSKKIVVITGSPRKKGNSFAMTDAFIEEAKAKGYTATRFDAAMMKLSGCQPVRPVTRRARHVPAFKRAIWIRFIRLSRAVMSAVSRERPR